MAVKGAASKDYIMKTLMSTFQGSFYVAEKKEIRIPIIENDELIQIKVTLTAAKDIIENDSTDEITKVSDAEGGNAEMTNQEVDSLIKLMAEVGMI